MYHELLLKLNNNSTVNCATFVIFCIEQRFYSDRRLVMVCLIELIFGQPSNLNVVIKTILNVLRTVFVVKESTVLGCYLFINISCIYA